MAMKTVTFRLTDKQHQQARAKAKDEGITLSQKMRWFVRQWIADDKETNDETPSQAVASES